MTAKILQTLEFHKCIEKLLQHTHTSLSHPVVTGLLPSQDINEIRAALAETDEAVQIDRLKGIPPFGGIRNITAALSRAAIGGMLSAGELVECATTLGGGRQLRRFISGLDDRHQYPIIVELAEQITELRPVEDDILTCIGEQGEVLDAASSELARIRSSIRTIESRVRDRLDQMVKNTSTQKMLQDSIVTIRSNRYVIPVKQEYRAHFGGIIHDQSASGATLFIEPEAVVNMNNELRELRLQEEREIEAVLRRLSARIAEHEAELKINIDRLGRIDFIFAKANLAREMKATLPAMNDQGYLRLKKGRHPLISLDHVVPIDVELGKQFHSIIVTGPNTGGKTVTLKTIGLLSIMAASGLFIPAEDGSELAVFDSVFADIGDEQSIEQNLSTFSSHLTNIIRILQEMTPRSLILLDELGAGTDPSEGSALAIAILEHIHQSGCRVVATTHYSELKAYAYDRDGVMNASMEFDVATLRPTYRLLLGVPGRSNALAIAERLGLMKPIIESARNQISTEDRKVDTMLASLEENRLVAEQERREAEQLRQEVEQLRSKLQAEKAKFADQTNKLMEKSEKEAAEAVAKAQREADEIIAELRRMAMEEQASIKEHKLIAAKRQLELAKPSLRREKVAHEDIANNMPVQPGDEVHVISVGQKGFVIEQAGNDAFTVQLGIIKMKVHRNDMRVIKEQPAKVPTRSGANVNRTRDEGVKTEVDLRGISLEEAIMEVDKLLDDAIMSNLGQVHIIHGKGTGVLRSGIQAFLRKHKHVKSFRNGEFSEGGTGVTVAELK